MAPAFARLTRLRDISAVVARHGLDHVWEQRRAKKPRKARDAGGTEQDQVRARALAKRFRNVLEELGTTFIKFGQILSTRGDLVSPELAHELSQLQDRCAPLPFSTIENELILAFGRRPGEVFASLDPEPLASASIAQVHAATLHGGEHVVVKVQRPGIAETIIHDLDLLRSLARLCEAIIEESGVVMPRAVVDTFEEALLEELDFSHEARIIARFEANLVGRRRPYVVPRVHEAYSTPTVLTLSRLYGRRLSELTEHDDGPAIARQVVSTCFEQIFVDGLFHADPHPGNCLLQDDGRLALLDFGMTGTISYAMRETLVMLVIAVSTRDADAVARLLYRVGVPEERVLLHALRDACASLLDERLRDRQAFAQTQTAGLLQDLFTLAARFGIRVPSEYALIGRAAVTVEGVLRQLDPTFAVVEHAKPMLMRLVEEQFALRDLGQGTLRNVMRARDLARQLPLTLSQIAMDLEAGKLRVQVDSAQAALIARSLDTLGLVICFGLVAAALIVGALLLLVPYTIEIGGVPLLPLLAINGAGLLLGAVVGRFMFGPRLRKISLSRLFSRRRRRSVRQRKS